MTTNSEKSILDAYGALKRELGLNFNQELKQFGCSYNQMLVISYLGRLGPLSASELSDYMLSDKASMSRTLSSLEKVGWIKRKPDPNDNRRVIVDLAGKGRKHAESLHEIRTGLSSLIDATLSPRDQVELLRLLNQVTQTLSKNRTDSKDKK